LPEDGLLGVWVVGGTTVTVTVDTKLKGVPPVVGLWAEVEGFLQEDGSVLAVKIEVEEPDDDGDMDDGDSDDEDEDSDDDSDGGDSGDGPDDDEDFAGGWGG